MFSIGWHAIVSVGSIFFLSFCLFRAAPVAYGGSQARGPIGAVVAGLCHSHSNLGSKWHLQPTTHGNTRSLTHWARPGIEPASLWTLLSFVNCWARTGTPRRPFLPPDQTFLSFPEHESPSQELTNALISTSGLRGQNPAQTPESRRLLGLWGHWLQPWKDKKKKEKASWEEQEERNDHLLSIHFILGLYVLNCHKNPARSMLVIQFFKS